MSPTVSIVVPTLNAARYLQTSLNSIAAQTYGDYEILLVDGGSTDETMAIASGYTKLTVVEQQGKGLAGAWNDGIIKARGKYIAFLDSDDIWEEDCLQQHTELLANPALLCSIGHLRFFLDDPEVVPPGFKRSLLQDSHLGYMPGCFLGKKEVFEKIGLFDTKWNIASDIVWFAKLKKFKERTGIIPGVILRKRVHAHNLSYTTAETPIYKRELLQFLHEHRNSEN